MVEKLQDYSKAKKQTNKEQVAVKIIFLILITAAGFAGCKVRKSQNETEVKTSPVIDGAQRFYNCTSIYGRRGTYKGAYFDKVNQTGYIDYLGDLWQIENCQGPPQHAGATPPFECEATNEDYNPRIRAFFMFIPNSNRGEIRLNGRNGRFDSVSDTLQCYYQ